VWEFLLSSIVFLNFFETIVNGVVFLYFSICSLLVYRKATDFFYKLTLYPGTLLKVFVVSRSFFLVESFRSFRHKIMLSANRDSSTSSFPICISFI
jgi:hypothetical protein